MGYAGRNRERRSVHGKGSERNRHRRNAAVFEHYFKVVPSWRRWFLLWLLLVDTLVMVSALAVSFWLNPWAYEALQRIVPIVVFTMLLCGVWLVTLWLSGSYRRHKLDDGFSLYETVFNAVIGTVILTGSAAYMLHMEIPRTAVIIAPVVAGVLGLFARRLLRRVLLNRRSDGRCSYATVLVGSPAGIGKSLRTLSENRAFGYLPIAVCPIAVCTGEDGESVRNADYREIVSNPEFVKPAVLPFAATLPEDALALGAQTVLIVDALPRESSSLHALALATESLGMELAVSVSFADLSGHDLYLRNSAQQDVLTASLPQYSLATTMFKRVFDVIGASLALLISAPLVMLPVALAIRCEDGGPIFYRQERVGRKGRPFVLYKFRSMQVDAERLDSELARESGQQYGALFKMRSDPRVTRVGRWIRKYSLDEFPQFLNVLLGDMSLVGPRPQRKYEVDNYGELYSTRLLVKPGITGPWQISGRSDLSQAEAERLDVSYIEHWSITGDVVILLKTVVAVLRAVGSY
ncbi:sugar transferase [Bifidobacterium crudilactis]|uniref:sugar transferase n=1 Tax=Bifidobacterium crudilactis TaxID=327277 RepID=UPI000691B808|nr:sugar transferase [Bifidobacterium crudilactis]MCI2149121.1 sugar transferase [Bifidobacterium crudilactis]MCI2157632.1 sugar transferase [Bifidobacterium crudilactis]